MNAETISILQLFAGLGVGYAVILLFAKALRKDRRKVVDSYGRLKLKLELIPWTAKENLRTKNSPAGWEQIRRQCISGARNRCEICDARWCVTDCHEVWNFWEGVQRLIKVQCLCKKCHQAKHIGFALSHQDEKGVIPYDTLIDHLARVNRQSVAYIEHYVQFSLDRVAELANRHSSWVLILKAPRERTGFPSDAQRRNANAGWR